jgi:hypothetical protein
MNKPHKLGEVIIAWAEGKIVQCQFITFSNNDMPWTDWKPGHPESPGLDIPDFGNIAIRWRVKPKILKYKIAVLKTFYKNYFVVLCESEGQATSFKSRNDFVKFSTEDWIEIEV